MPINSFDNYPLSWKPEKEKLTTPYYLSLYKDLEEKISSGLLAEGTRLPPQRELADFLDLNYSTITRVYNLARKNGLIYGITGKGTFVAPHASGDITINEVTPGGLIEMGSVTGFPEYAATVEEAAKHVLSRGYLRNLLDYSFPYGQPHQLEAGRQWMARMGVHADADHMAIFTGSENAISVALASLFRAGDAIAVDAYTYSNLIELARMLSLRLIPIPGSSHGMSSMALALACQKRTIKGIYLMPSGSNPTNVVISEGRREELARVIAKYHLTLIEDDLYGWLAAAMGTALPPLFERLPGKAVYIASTTKNLCPGLRIAFAAFKDDVKDTLLHGLSNMNIKTSALDGEIISELILSGAAWDLAAHKVELARDACALFDRYFPGVQQGRVSYFRWLPIGGNASFGDVEADLAALGVHIFHSGRFQVEPHAEKNYLRVALCSAGSRGKLDKGLRILRDYVETQKRS